VQVQPEAEPETDDLRGTIAAAMEAANAPEETVEQTPAPKSSAPEPASTVTPPADADVPASATEPGADTSKPDNAEGAEPAPAVTDKVEAPSNWSKADKERFAEWPESAQKQVLERHRAMEADYTRKTMENAELKREYSPVEQMFAPFKDMLRQSGRTPSSVIRDWANAEAALGNPGTREDAIVRIIKGYNADPQKIYSLLGGGQQQPQQPVDLANMTEQQQIAELLNPMFKQNLSPIEHKMQQLEQQLQQAQQFQYGAVNAQRQQIFQTVTNELEAFANATDPKTGQLLYPYFNDVQSDMTAIMKGYYDQGRNLTLIEAYNAAVRANPSTLERITAQQTKAAEVARTQEARAKSAQAKRAGSSVVGTPGSGQFVHANGDGRDLGSLRETIQAALEASRV
jgi:hypothetical protein